MSRKMENLWGLEGWHLTKTIEHVKSQQLDLVQCSAVQLWYLISSFC